MRSLSIVLACITLVACDSGKKKPSSDESAPKTQPKENDVPITPVKRAVPTAPLPGLAADAGGATGKPIWQFGFGGYGIDVPRGVAVGAGGDIYVGGYFDGETDFGAPAGKVKSNGGSDGYVLKLSNDGKLAWASTFGSKRDDDVKAIAARGDKVIVVGNFTDELKIGEFDHKAVGSDDLFAIVLDKDGKPQWLWTLGGIDSDGANAVAATPDGGWVIGGSYTDSITIGQTTIKSKGLTDAMLVKLAASGDIEWIKSFGGRYKDTIMHVAVDGNGNIYVQGHFADVADWGGKPLKAHGGSDNDVVLAKYDTNGDHVWSKNFGNMFNDVAGGITVDPAGNITIVGSFENKGTISFGEGDEHASLGEADAYIARFDTAGKLQWVHTFGAEREDVGWGVASDSSGNTIMTGWFQNTVDFGKGAVVSKGNKDVFAVKYDAKGAVVWVQTWGDHDHDQGRAIAVDDKGNAIVACAYRFALALVGPALDSKRPADDPVLSKAPKPDTAVVKLAR
jgi:hypothetical protein